MLGVINSNNYDEILKLIGYLSINDVDIIYIKRVSLSKDELDSIVSFGIDYGVKIYFGGLLYSYNKVEKYDLNLKIVNSNIDKIIQIQILNVNECLIFNGDSIIYYNESILLENKLCLIIDKLV